MRRWGAAGLAALVVVGISAVVVGVQQQRAEGAGGAYYSIDPPSQVVQSDASEVSVAININDVSNLGAFEFRIVYFSGVLKLKEIQRGPFITSSGRNVTCLTGEKLNFVDENDGIAKSTVQWGCTTSGAADTGPSGDGLAARVIFTPVGPGTSPIVFNKVEFSAADDDASAIPADLPHEAAVEVVGADDNTNEPPPPTPTHNATLLTPTPVSGAPDDDTYRLTDPQPDVEPSDDDAAPTGNIPGASDGGASSGNGSAPGGSGSSGTPSGSQTSGNSRSGSSGSVLGRAGSNFPVAGYGATVATMELASRIPLAGRVLLSLGVLLVGVGAYARRQRLQT